MNRVLSLILFALLFSQLCKGQSASSANDNPPATEFYSKEFKWKMLVPSGFEKQTTSQFAAMNNSGMRMLEKGLGTKIADYPTEQVCSFKYGRVNYFEVNKHIFNKALYGDFLTSIKSVEDEFYTGFRTKVPEKFKIDTIRSTETIDGLIFQNFKLRVNTNGKVVAYMDFYSRQFDTQIFSVIIVYADQENGERMLEVWKSSKFEKN